MTEGNPVGHRSFQRPITASNCDRHRCVIVASLLIQRLAATRFGVDFCDAADHDDILIVYMTDNTCIDYRTIYAHPHAYQIPLFSSDFPAIGEPLRFGTFTPMSHFAANVIFARTPKSPHRHSLSVENTDVPMGGSHYFIDRSPTASFTRGKRTQGLRDARQGSLASLP
ncbi:hypothetical protein [Lysobacter sp. Hz 25]|uniref:hypothetical protein n=1 Tax=Lysobacter sp. Hz 25 TaxID=3383698 RepID=UPI0038D44887